MKSKNNKILLTILIFIFMLIAYFFWRSLRPVDIIAVYQDDDYSSVLLRIFPITDRGQINWWLKNKDMLQRRYNIPQPDSDGNFTVIIWGFGEGYKEQGDESKDDRFCFVDFHTPKNCIDKNKEFYLTYSKNTGINFITNSTIYRIDKSGKSVKKSN